MKDESPSDSGQWKPILRNASLSDSATVTEAKREAAFFFQLLTLLLPLALCSCGKERAAGVDGTSESVKMPARGSTVSIVAVGDILLGSSSAPQLATNGYNWPFEHVQPLLQSADLVIGNLAAPIITKGKKVSENQEYSYKVSPVSAVALKQAGFHALSLGNNHMLDYGVSGLRETMAALRTNNIATFGAGESEQEARRGFVCDFGTLRIGLLGYGDEGSETKTIAKGKRGGYALLSEKNLTEDIAEMRKRADCIVVSLHWGKNYKDVTEAQQKMGRRAIELGADIVCGHHPHIAQGIEVFQGKPIIYSLGNFVFGTKGRYPEGKQGYGLVSRWLFEGKTLKWVMATPIAINNELVKFQPMRVPAEEARQALEPHLKRYGTPVRWKSDTAFIGLGSEWQNAALPNLPWKDQDGAITGAAPAASVPTTASQ